MGGMCRCYGGRRKDNILYSGCEKSLREVLEGLKEREKIHGRDEGFPSARTFARGLPLGKS